MTKMMRALSSKAINTPSSKSNASTTCFSECESSDGWERDWLHVVRFAFTGVNGAGEEDGDRDEDEEKDEEREFDEELDDDDMPVRDGAIFPMSL